MPIAVTCSGCDKSYQVKDEFAGKKVRCPQCQAVVTIGQPQPATAKGRKAAAKADEYEDYPDDVEDYGDDDDYFDEPRVLKEAPRLKAKRAKVKAKKRGERSEPLQIPWGLILSGILICGLVLAGGLIFIFPPAAIALAILVVIAGWGLGIVGGIGLIVRAFQEDVVCGILYIFVPFYWLYYLVSRWDDNYPFGECHVGGVLITLMGMGLIYGSTAYVQGRSQSPQFAPRPQAEFARPVNLQPMPAGQQPANPQPRFDQFDPPAARAPAGDARPRVKLTQAEADLKTKTVPAGHRFQRGDKVYLEWAGDWNECEVLDVNNPGLPTIRWIGWGEAWDEVVTPDRVRIPK